MNDDSDVSEYVDESDRQPVRSEARSKAPKPGKGRSKNANIKREATRGPSAESEDLNGTANAASQKSKAMFSVLTVTC